MIAICVAFRDEVKDYLKAGRFKVAARDGYLRFHQSKDLPGIVVIEGGFGNERAREAVVAAVERYGPEAIVSAGFAGAVKEGIEPGDLYICERLLCLEGSAALWGAEGTKEGRPLDTRVLRKLIRAESQAFRSGGCLTVPQLVSGGAMKDWIGKTYPVSLIDMESYWASEAAREASVPFLAVRAVLDPLDQTLPPFVARATENPGRVWLEAVRYLFTRPSDAPQLLRLRSQSRAARAALAGFLSRLVPPTKEAQS